MGAGGAQCNISKYVAHALHVGAEKSRPAKRTDAESICPASPMRESDAAGVLPGVSPGYVEPIEPAPPGERVRRGMAGERASAPSEPTADARATESMAACNAARDSSTVSSAGCMAALAAIRAAATPCAGVFCGGGVGEGGRASVDSPRDRPRPEMDGDDDVDERTSSSKSMSSICSLDWLFLCDF